MLGKFRLADLSVPLKHVSASEPVPDTIRYARHQNLSIQEQVAGMFAQMRVLGER
jgi:hypothetical protein